MPKPLIHLFIPHLFQPLRAWKNNYQFEPSCTFLLQLLDDFKLSKQVGINGTDASLFATLGLSHNKELPVAYYRFQNHKNDQNMSHSFLCADPVHLEVGMSDITLTHKITDLTKTEAMSLRDLLNQHFNQDGLTFIIDSNEQWFLSFAGDDEISSTPLDVVLRKNIADSLIQSKSRSWAVLQNEMQMLLHSAPVNQQREMAGLPTVNSLWLWGGGKPQAFSQKATQVFSDNKNRGEMIAKASECQFKPLSKLKDFTHFPEGKTMILCETLIESALNDDLDAYQQALNKLDKELIEPLFKAWKAGEINLKLDSCNGTTITPHPKSAWKFWKKTPSSLSALDL